ncbi:MAG: ATP-binding protein [Armatimonadia bacterium]
MSEDGKKQHNGESTETTSPRGNATIPPPDRPRNRSRSLRAYLTYLSAALIIIPAVVSGIVLGLGARSTLEQQVFRHLQDVCDGKAEEIGVLLEGWISTVDRFSHRPLLLDSIAECQDSTLSPAVRDRARRTLDWMMHDLSLSQGRQVGDAFVLDIHSMRPIAWSGFRDAAQVAVVARHHPPSQLPTQHNPIFTEPYLDPVSSVVVFDIVHVLRRSADETGPDIAMLVLRLYAPAVLYPRVQQVSALGRSARAQILDRQQRLLTELPGLPETIMQPGGPLALHLAGAPGTITAGRDYRGIMAFAAQAQIPVTGWSVTYKVDASEAMAGVNRISLLWLLLVALLLTGGLAVAYRTARRVAGPVLEVSSAARRVAEGDLDTRVYLDREDELGTLARDFNYMAQRMVVSREELEEQVRARTAELTAANETLRRLNEEMTSFTYSVSHDLSSPLVSLQGLTGMIVRDYSDRLDEEGRRRLGRLQANVESMETLVSDLLELSRIGRVTGRVADLDPAIVAREVVVNLADLIAEGGATVILPQQACPLVHADTNRLRQVLSNLIANALKYRHPERPLTVELSCRLRDDGMVEVAVADNGMGIAPEYHEKIFLPFQRLPEARRTQGTGMGLAIVRKIVEYHGGRVWVESAPGEGTVFYFTLPKAGEPGGGSSQANPAGGG